MTDIDILAGASRTTVEAVRLYSVATVAERLDVSKDWVYDRINAGALAVVELGDTKTKQRIRADVLQAFIDGRSYGSKPTE
ncbi:MAG: binding domain, excisionase family [Glaciihabitans sp.]|nr:binding domain, excisionase family [Glaciihabitans sp.]